MTEESVPLLLSTKSNTYSSLIFCNEEIIFETHKQMCSLGRDGIFSQTQSNHLLVALGDIVGVKRIHDKILLIISYPLVAPSRLCCCGPRNHAKRTRTETRLEFFQEDAALRWESALWQLLLPKVSPPSRKRRFLILINPKSGTGKSDAIFQKHCLPLFNDANIECTLLRTEFPGHASAHCETNEDIPTFDGIVIVSGDGLMFEALQGLMKRPDWAHVLKHVPLGIIPGGSGNGLAVSLSRQDDAFARAHPHNNAFLIAKGETSPFDLCMVDHETKGRLYSFLSLEYGFAAEIDVGSDYMRSLGEVRFTLEALKQLINPTHTRIKFSHVKFDGQLLPSYWEANGFAGAGGPQTLLNNVEWLEQEEDVYFMWNCNVSWMSQSAFVSPNSRPNDGCCQVCFLRHHPRRGKSRWHIARFLLALETGAHVDFPFLETFPARAYRIEPIVGPYQTRIAIDGEEVPVGTIQVEVLPGIATLMGFASRNQFTSSLGNEMV